ncbi:MAG: phosphoglucomutase/phosphomannomutase family protein [Deltaproteobacteria bacterium]|nr:phosphoglucomutase/phosphomannomutase family protein [Deltaproteobacteria bacterium]
MSIKFGTDGWRGIIGRDFTFENVARVAQAFADLVQENRVFPKRAGNIILGYDRRFQSPEFANTIASVLTANSLLVERSSSFCPTPTIAWLTKDKKGTAGVIITASHNPAIWNGVKFKESYGGAASPESTMAVETKIEENEKKGRSPSMLDLEEAGKKRLLTGFDPGNDYVTALQQFVALEKIQKSHWKIGFDPLYGAGTGFLSKVLKQDLAEIHQEENPSFGGLNPEPIEKNLKELIQTVRDKKLDVGLATDGDADRIGAVDETGRFVDSHHIFALILRHLVEVRGWKGGIVKTVSTTGMIEQLCRKYQLPLHETAIGFKHICKKFLEVEKPLMGGEESGGIAICQHLYERDGLLSGLLLLEIMAHHERRLGELIRELHQEVGPHFFERNDLHLSETEVEKVRTKLPTKKIETLAGQKVANTNQVDGCKYTLANGSWLLVRPSGTEPLLRLYAEADEPEKVKKLLQAAREILPI